MTTLTERQLEVLRFVERTIAARSVAPTLREIAQAFGFASTASAQKHILVLERKGLLRREKHQKRGLSLGQQDQRESRSETTVPLLGVVAAGSPIESVAEPESLSVPPTLLRAGEHFALRVRGESMVEDGIYDDDVVLVQRRSQAREGEMVVALVGGEVTLKRFFRHADGAVRLEPANASFRPLIVGGDQVQIQGIVVALLRRY